jgi:tryptophanyl-tRNA synthetase
LSYFCAVAGNHDFTINATNEFFQLSITETVTALIAGGLNATESVWLSSVYECLINGNGCYNGAVPFESNTTTSESIAEAVWTYAERFIHGWEG